jgi:hypothetical protein
MLENVPHDRSGGEANLSDQFIGISGIAIGARRQSSSGPTSPSALPRFTALSNVDARCSRRFDLHRFLSDALPTRQAKCDFLGRSPLREPEPLALAAIAGIS